MQMTIRAAMGVTMGYWPSSFAQLLQPVW